MQGKARTTSTSIDEASPSGAELILQPGETLGRYVVERTIGAGAMGIVYLCRDFGLGRCVALKLVRENGRPHRSARLLREAQLLARLCNPHIVRVYDVGTRNRQLYIALEYVDGTSVAEWLGERSRSCAEIVDLFAQAGKGLAAAHGAGVVHRDFKPENILISRSGAVQVTDFGLARLGSEREGDSPEPMAGEDAAQLTRTGACLGTPAYMAPEQHRGEPASARTDQYAFCVSLHEALCGERPDCATNDGSPAFPAHHQHRVPLRLRRLLRRGLQADPKRRFSSVDELLQVLAPPPASRRFAIWAIAVALACAGVVTLRIASTRALARCVGGAARIDPAWGQSRRAAVRSAFLATNRAYAPAAFHAVEVLVDGYVGDWRRSHEAACQAAWSRREQSESLLDGRMVCLDERAAELGALTTTLQHADETIVEHAYTAASMLSPVALCDDGRRLLAKPPIERAATPEAEQIQTLAAEARQNLALARYPVALAQAKQAAERAAALGAPQLEAGPLLTQGELQAMLGHEADAERLLDRATVRAEAAGDFDTAAAAWSALSATVGQIESRFDEGGRWAAHAEALIPRTSNPELTRAHLDEVRGALALARGRGEEAQRRFRQAVEVYQRRRADDGTLAVALGRLGTALHASGHQNEALAAHQKALALMERSLGPLHPDLGSVLSGMGKDLWELDREEEAVAAFRRALAIRESAFGENHFTVAQSLSDLAATQWSNQQFRSALGTASRAAAILEKTMGKDDPGLAHAVDLMAWSLLEEGRTDEALTVAQRALDIRLHVYGERSGAVGNNLCLIGKVHFAQHRFADALHDFRASELASSAALPRDHFNLAFPLEGQGEVLLATAQWRAALQPFAPGLRIRQQGEGGTSDQFIPLFGLARATWEVGDHDRARAFALQARDTLARAPSSAEPTDPDLVRVNRWLRAHR